MSITPMSGHVHVNLQTVQRDTLQQVADQGLQLQRIHREGDKVVISTGREGLAVDFEMPAPTHQHIHLVPGKGPEAEAPATPATHDTPLPPMTLKRVEHEGSEVTLVFEGPGRGLEAQTNTNGTLTAFDFHSAIGQRAPAASLLHPAGDTADQGLIANAGGASKYQDLKLNFRPDRGSETIEFRSFGGTS